MSTQKPIPQDEFIFWLKRLASWFALHNFTCSACVCVPKKQFYSACSLNWFDLIIHPPKDVDMFGLTHQTLIQSTQWFWNIICFGHLRRAVRKDVNRSCLQAHSPPALRRAERQRFAEAFEAAFFFFFKLFPVMQLDRSMASMHFLRFPWACLGFLGPIWAHGHPWDWNTCLP